MNSLRQMIAAASLAGAVASGVSCGDTVRQGHLPVRLVLGSLQGLGGSGTSGSSPASSVLNSDVEIKGSVFNDLGTALMRIIPKNINTTPSGPSLTTNNEVRITRVHVAYRRTDGQNQPGVDVPYPFDSGATVTLPVTGLAVPVVF